MTIEDASSLLGLSAQQVRRLSPRFVAEGAAALVHGSRGRPAANRIAEALKSRLLQLAETEYAGFSDVHLQEAAAARFRLH